MAKKPRRHDRTSATLERRKRSRLRREENRKRKIKSHIKKHQNDELARIALENPGKHRKHLR